VADPPSTSSTWPKGVFTESNAMEPTTSNDMFTSELYLSTDFTDNLKKQGHEEMPEQGIKHF
jgi:hypothetical protein